jgi:DNA mismatch endonuclease (patch repair protein)
MVIKLPYLYTMADVHSKETRSYNMSRIRSKDIKPEMLVRRFLHKNGFRYRLHVKDLPGKPDNWGNQLNLRSF